MSNIPYLIHRESGIMMRFDQSSRDSGDEMDDDRFWKLLKEKFDEMSAAFDSVRTPSKNELDAYKIALRYPKYLASKLHEKRKAGYSIFSPKA